jgi:hypothetical protein
MPDVPDQADFLTAHILLTWPDGSREIKLFRFRTATEASNLMAAIFECSEQKRNES